MGEGRSESAFEWAKIATASMSRVESHTMSTDTKELIRICEQLPEEKRVEVADFARFLLAQQGDERWEQIIASPERRPKLDAFLNESAKETAQPLDLDRL